MLAKLANCAKLASFAKSYKSSFTTSLASPTGKASDLLTILKPWAR